MSMTMQIEIGEWPDCKILNPLWWVGGLNMILGLVPFRNPSCIEKMKCVKFSFLKKKRCRDKFATRWEINKSKSIVEHETSVRLMIQGRQRRNREAESRSEHPSKSSTPTDATSAAVALARGYAHRTRAVEQLRPFPPLLFASDLHGAASSEFHCLPRRWSCPGLGRGGGRWSRCSDGGAEGRRTQQAWRRSGGGEVNRWRREQGGRGSW
jgi:hypothetical protein